MKKIVGFVVLVSTSALVACASQVPASSTAPAASQAPSTASQAAPAASQAAPAAGQEAAPAAASTTPFTVPAGYRHVIRGDQELFCRDETVTGSRAQKIGVCLTYEQLQAERDASRDLMQRVQQNGAANSRPCMPGAAPCP